jgi:hypothetical protein
MVRKAKSVSPRRQRKSKSPKTRRSSKKAGKKAGSRKKVNKWVSHVLKQSKKLNLSFKDALSDARVKKSYKA